ncbi:response regulator transcription factor [Kitasatospora sp. NBC_01287]|uniref:response regulator n=1 Tax=Kitasatospora sp. NBC_01287 TaxID=2903573 RepID=UPI00224EC58D|nr:response regulator transcription factor [Kitasatospora sp. NBC_01287]MCX4746145.1 response regulator transcription factor [Kitasatospora sp. NBC_01287]
MTITVVLADDQPLVRAGLRLLIASAPDIEIVGEAGTGTEAVQLAKELRPDVVVMDIRMPVMDGIEATRRIKAHAAGVGPGAVGVVMLTTFDDNENVYAALYAGASGFLVKDTVLDEILAAIRVVAGGEALLAPGVTRRLIERFTDQAQAAEPRRRLKGITEREREVLTLIGRGMSNSEISTHLHISMATAKTHVARLLAKLDARDRVQLAIAAHEAKIVPQSD